jgi:predicted ATPase
MTRIRKIEITNFRSIQRLQWTPSRGINCLIGPGDAGKSTILEAIDLCLGARRTIQFSDADFFDLDATSPISVTLTLGELDDALKSIDTYGLFLRGYNAGSGVIEDEPGLGLESVLCLNLSVGDDLEPTWTLVSQRAQAQNAVRNLSWGDRTALTPTRIGALAHLNFGWRKGSVLNRLTEEKADASAALARAARDARAGFGDEVESQLGETLRIVGDAAKSLGIHVGSKVRALLDAHSVSFSGGTIALHNEAGVPLRGLGTGSTRLLIAGLQRQAASDASLLLVDEVEHGLEPHRIIRFLSSLGAKELEPPLQVFMTTHSPVVVRELAASQLMLVRTDRKAHQVIPVGVGDNIQGTIRAYPDAFLAESVLVCEGASEVGIVRGLDFEHVRKGVPSIFASGTALIDCGGGEADKPFKRAEAFQRLGYRVAVLRDDDTTPTPTVESTFSASGGAVFKWRDGRAIEDELFASFPVAAIGQMVEFAVSLHEEPLIDSHIKTASRNELSLEHVRTEIANGTLAPNTRAVLGAASRTKRNGWFKSVSWMEELGSRIAGPALQGADSGFQQIVRDVFTWMSHDA